MTRYILLLICYIPFYLLAMLLTPFLPLFAKNKYGPIGNNNGFAIEPRLPTWLRWFDTVDNSLYGDGGWREKHQPKLWNAYLGMVLWLWRNPANGFAWSMLAQPILQSDIFTYTHSGNGLDVDKGRGKLGWYYIKCSNGAFSLRWCKRISSTLVLSFEAGWLLDIYIKDDSAYKSTPFATFQFQPQLKRI